MSECLETVIAALDYCDDEHFSYFQVQAWLPDSFASCLASGLLVPDQLGTQSTCPTCAGPVEVVECLKVTTEVWLLCEECGRSRVPTEQAAGWRLDMVRLFELLLSGAQIHGPRTEVVRDRVWRLGKSCIGGASRTCYFARQLQRLDAQEVLEKAALPAGAVVFVPRNKPPAELRIEPLPLLVPLVEIVSWQGHELALDLAFIESQIAALNPAASAEDARSSKRGSRLSLIEALKRALIEHLQASRDHALATLQATGTPKLLPRPTHELLAKLLGVHRTTVSRCLEDGSAPELVTLWELAVDVDRILGAETSG